MSWTLVSCATVLLLVSAVTRTDKRICAGVQIRIAGVKNNFFLDQSDIRRIILNYSGGPLEGRPVADLNLRAVEQALERDLWIRDAELFVDNNAVLQVDVDEREPVARIFSVTGGSFYIDSALTVLPLSERVSARVPVFTGFPTETKIMSAEEKDLLKHIRTLGIGLYEDPFLMAMIDQVAITPKKRFELFPKIGDHVVVFGGSDDVEDKLEKLKLFYKKVLPGTGWNRYSEVNLMYSNQVVAKLRSKQDVASDSLRTLQLMKMVAAYTAKMAEDTTLTYPMMEDAIRQDVSMVMQSVQREEVPAMPLVGEPVKRAEPAPAMVTPSPVKANAVDDRPKTVPAKKPAEKPEPKAENKPARKPQATVKPETPQTQTNETKQHNTPKAVMPSRTQKPDNDY